MKVSSPINLIVFFIVLFSMSACATTPYTKDSTIIGTIEELITKENFLFDNHFLLITASRDDTQNYEIPVDSFNDYNVGQQVQVVVYSNSAADVWDIDHMKFEITVIE